MLGVIALAAGADLVVGARGPGQSVTTTTVTPAIATATTATTVTTVIPPTKPGAATTTTATSVTTAPTPTSKTVVTASPGHQQVGSDALDTLLLAAGAVLVLCAVSYDRISKISFGGAEIDLTARAQNALQQSSMSGALASARQLATSGAPDLKGLSARLRRQSMTSPRRATDAALDQLDERLELIECQTLEVRLLGSGARWLGGHWTIAELVHAGALDGGSASFCVAVLDIAQELEGPAAVTRAEWVELFELVDDAYTVLSPAMLFRSRVEHELRGFGYGVARTTDQADEELSDLIVTLPHTPGAPLRVSARTATDTNHKWLDTGTARLATREASGAKLLIVPSSSRSLDGLVQAATRLDPRPSPSGKTFREVQQEPAGNWPGAKGVVVRMDPQDETNEVLVVTLSAVRSFVRAHVGAIGEPPGGEALKSRLRGVTVQQTAVRVAGSA